MKKTTTVIKKWQLLKWRSHEELADLSEEDFVAVGKRVFYRSRALEEARMPANAAAIKTEAFTGCKRLHTITLPSNNSVGLARRSFADCIRLRNVHNSELISVIGDRAFENCRNLPALTFGRDLRRIGEYAFAGCESIRSLELPSCINVMGRGAFFACTELESVHMEDALTTLAPDAFRDCISLREIGFSAMLEEIPKGAFRGCSSLTELTVPSGINVIGARAFMECNRLREVTIDIGTTEIGAKAFAKTPRLERVFVPHSVKKLGLGAFGFGFSKQKITLVVDNEYMKKRMQTQLRLCMSAGRVNVEVVGKTIEERKRERRRASLEQKPTHLFDIE